MFKFFTIIFLIYYTIRLFKPSLFTKTLNNANNVVKEYESIENKNEKDEFLLNNFKPVLAVIPLFLFITTQQIAEIIYIFSAVEYGNPLITVGFIIWWLFLLVKEMISTKIAKSNGTIYKEIKTVSIWRIFVILINILYFGYMYFIVFIK